MPINTHNMNGIGIRDSEINGVLSVGATSSGLKFRIGHIWELYVDRYLYNKKDLWFTREEPYIYYRHLFRKFLYDNVTSNKSKIQRLEKHFSGNKPHNNTITNSVEKDPKHLPLQDFIIEDINNFLKQNLEMTLDARIRNKVKKARDQGYLIEDIARNCYVHEEAIEKLLQGKTLPTNILNQMEREL